MSKVFRLYCGRTTRAGDHVNAAQINVFLRDVVASRFPGFSVLEGFGYWNGAREYTNIIEISGDDTNAPAINEIAEAYATDFDQEAVLVTVNDVSSTFVSARKRVA